MRKITNVYNVQEIVVNVMEKSVRNVQIYISYRIILVLKVVIKAIMLIKKIVTHAHKIVKNVTTKDYVKNVNLISICFKIYV